MAVTNYTGKGEIYVNSRLLAEAKSIQCSVSTNDTQVATLQKGNAGFSDGATSTAATVESAVPRKGFEKDFLKAATKRETVTIVIKLSDSNKIRMVGRFSEASFTSAVNSETMTTGTFVGGEPSFE